MLSLNVPMFFAAQSNSVRPACEELRANSRYVMCMYGILQRPRNLRSFAAPQHTHNFNVAQVYLGGDLAPNGYAITARPMKSSPETLVPM